MKFIHISDLHIGKNFYGISMADEDQPYWIEHFLGLVDKEAPDAILISGDVYDRSIPSKEAVNLLDHFFTELCKKEIPIFVISGNHDSGTRLQFGSELFANNNLYIAGEIKKEVMHVTLNDEFGPITFWLVPYLFPAAVEDALNVSAITNYDEAMRTLLANQDIDFTKRNIILSHQMVTNNGKPLETEGSEVMVGGVGNIDSSAYEGFDYVALGHIHASQAVGKETIRYSGSPLCYHFSESKKNKKGPVIVTINQKGDPLDIRIEELPVLHSLREIKGKFNDIVEQEIHNTNQNEYIRVTLTDDRVPINAIHELSDLFEKHGNKLMETTHEPERKMKEIEKAISKDSKNKSISDLFVDFYRERYDDEFPDDNEQSIIDLISSQVIHANEDEAVNKPSDKDIDKIIELAIKETN